MKNTNAIETKKIIDEIKAKLEALLPEYELVDSEIVKFNDCKLTGIAFRKDQQQAAPTIWLNDHIDAISAGVVSEDEVAEMIAEMIHSCDQSIPDMVQNPDIMTWDNVKDKIVLRLVDMGKNSLYLADKPYREVGGSLAVIAAVQLSKEYAAVVTNDVLESFGINEENLFSTGEAHENPCLTAMEDALYSSQPENLLDKGHSLGLGLYVLSNSEAFFGSPALFLPGIKEKLHVMCGGDYYVLPSSVHELLIFPDDGETSVERLKEMVSDANNSVVEPQDVLSDNVFKYSDKGFAIA